jgi:hypothetical protein
MMEAKPHACGVDDDGLRSTRVPGSVLGVGHFSRALLGHSCQAPKAIGALLVFLTFIMWEAVRDHLKDIDNELDSIATRHEITAGTTSILRHLQLAERRADGSFKINTETEGLGPVGFMSYLDIQTLKATQQDARRSEEMMSRDFEYNMSLLKKRRSHAEGAVLVQERVASDLNACKLADEALVTTMKSYIPPPWSVPSMAEILASPQYQKLAEKVKSVASALSTAQGDENRFSESIVKSVEEEKVKAECWKTFAPPAGICFYTLGWALAFVGKIVGAKRENIEVE